MASRTSDRGHSRLLAESSGKTLLTLPIRQLAYVPWKAPGARARCASRHVHAALAGASGRASASRRRSSGKKSTHRRGGLSMRCGAGALDAGSHEAALRCSTRGRPPCVQCRILFTSRHTPLARRYRREPPTHNISLLTAHGSLHLLRAAYGHGEVAPARGPNRPPPSEGHRA